MSFFESGRRLHALNQEVEVWRRELHLLFRQQRQGRFLHALHGFNHAGHRNTKAVVHLASTHQTDLLDHFGAAGQNSVGDQTEVPAVVAKALGPLALTVGIATRGCLLYTSDAADE